MAAAICNDLVWRHTASFSLGQGFWDISIELLTVVADVFDCREIDEGRMIVASDGNDNGEQKEPAENTVKRI